MVSDSVEIRMYKAGDEEGINRLFNRTFGKSRTLQEWKRKYMDNPAVGDLSQWIAVMERRGEIVGHLAGLPIEMHYKDLTVKAALMVDMMIDSSVKGGLEYPLDLFAFAAEKIRNTALFSFGFPNEIAFTIGKWVLSHQGYREVGKLVQLFKRLSWRNAVKRRFRWCPSFVIDLIHLLGKTYYRLEIASKGGCSGTRISITHCFDERVDALWDRVAGIYGISTVRKLTYLKWRYEREPYVILLAEKGTSLVGYAVVSISNHKDVRAGYIVDMIADKDYALATLAGALRYFMDHDVDHALCGVLSLDSSFCKVLSNMGLGFNKGFEPIRVTVIPLSPNADREFIYRPENWYLTYGDSDGW
jgi:hypothetical protein